MTNKRIKKVGLGLTAVMAVLSLFISPMLVLAESPNTTLSYLATNDNDPNDGWIKNVNINAGQRVQFYLEIHNTVVGTTAKSVSVKATLPENGGTSTATVWSENSNQVTDTVNVNTNGGKLQYVPGSTQITWDADGDGVKEYNYSAVTDGITGNGVTIGDQNGCLAYIIQITFLADVVGGVTPTPTPSPTPSATPSATPAPSATPTPAASPTPGTSPSPTPAGGINITNNNNNTNSNTNNNNININTGTATTAAVALKKTPDTGVGVLGMFGMFGAAPLGVILSRYGRGKMLVSKKEEDLNSIASGLVKSRSKQA